METIVSPCMRLVLLLGLFVNLVDTTVLRLSLSLIVLRFLMTTLCRVSSLDSYGYSCEYRMRESTSPWLRQRTLRRIEVELVWGRQPQYRRPYILKYR